jgi:xanthine dehydrogenase accessory factor
MNYLWSKIKEKLIENINVFLMVVIDVKGSSPGKPGFKMAVAADDDFFGSIGGGTMEYLLVEKCKNNLKENYPKISIQKIEHVTKEEDSLGMMCSGAQWVAFYHLSKKKHIDLVDAIVEIEKKEKDTLVIFDDSGIKLCEFNDYNNLVRKVINDKWFYYEQPGRRNVIYIIGGGHVSLALSKIMKELDFKIVVLDNRRAINTMKHNVYADELRFVDYENIEKYIPDGSNVYVVIMTFAHKYDIIVLRQTIRKRIKYLGMMGSENKVHKAFEVLKNEGVDEDILNNVYAPVGLEINSSTPAEIAVSIAAQIVKISKN